MSLLSDNVISGWRNQALSLTPHRNYAGTEQLDKTVRLIKGAIYLYVFLLVFEGSLRKWILPGLAAPLLIVRDPLALYIIFLCWKQKILPSNILLAATVWIGFISFFTALFLGHKNLFVAIFGARYLLIHFPLVFIIGQILDRADIIRIGKRILLISIPITVLTILQFYSPQSAWVNRGVGGDLEGAGFNGGAFGYFRPPGTFSFTNGNTMFYGLLAAFVFYFWLNSKHINKIILLAATFCLVTEIPISISRGLFFQILISVLFAVFAFVKSPKHLASMVFIAALSFFAMSLLQNIEFISTATEAFMQRFENASADEGGLQGTLVNRFLMGMFGSVFNTGNLPFWGYGLGLGTNVGSQLTTGDRQFLIAEDEWPRLIGEIGPLLGLLMVAIRLAFGASVIVSAYKKLKAGDVLPWMLASFGLILIVQGGWAQPTSLGFCTIAAGLVLASLKDTDTAPVIIEAADTTDGSTAEHIANN